MPDHHPYKAPSKSIPEIEAVETAFGTELKSLGNGRYGAWAVLFTNSADPDLTDDFFDNKTDFYFEGEKKAIRPLLYDHGLDPTLKARRIGRATLEIKDAGVWLEAQLDIADQYDKKYLQKYLPSIELMASKGKLGVSTGSAPHMIQREQVGKAFHLKSWPVVEVSLTPKPIEPRTKGFVSLKSFMEERVAIDFNSPETDTYLKREFSDEKREKMADKETAMEDGSYPIANAGDLSNAVQAVGRAKDIAAAKEHIIKRAKALGRTDLLPTNWPGSTKKSVDGRPLGDDFDRELAVSTHDLDKALTEICKSIALAASTEDISGAQVDVRAKVIEALTEYAARRVPIIVSQIGDYLANKSMGEFYLRSLARNPLDSFLEVKSVLVSGTKLDEHSAKVVSAVGEFADKAAQLTDGIKAWEKRVQDKADFRAETKSGRVISAATLEKLQNTRDFMGKSIEAMQTSQTHISDLIELAKPAPAVDPNLATEADKLGMRLDLQRLATRDALSGVST
jgi:hypothetical protein